MPDKLQWLVYRLSIWSGHPKSSLEIFTKTLAASSGGLHQELPSFLSFKCLGSVKLLFFYKMSLQCMSRFSSLRILITFVFFYLTRNVSHSGTLATTTRWTRQSCIMSIKTRYKIFQTMLMCRMQTSWTQLLCGFDGAETNAACHTSTLRMRHNLISWQFFRRAGVNSTCEIGNVLKLCCFDCQVPRSELFRVGVAPYAGLRSKVFWEQGGAKRVRYRFTIAEALAVELPESNCRIEVRRSRKTHLVDRAIAIVVVIFLCEAQTAAAVMCCVRSCSERDRLAPTACCCGKTGRQLVARTASELPCRWRRAVPGQLIGYSLRVVLSCRAEATAMSFRARGPRGGQSCCMSVERWQVEWRRACR